MKLFPSLLFSPHEILKEYKFLVLNNPGGVIIKKQSPGLHAMMTS